MNVFRFEVTALKFSALLWGVGLCLLVTLYLTIYPAFSRDVESLQRVFANLPVGVKHVIGLGTLDIFSFVGFFANIFPIITLAGAVQAMNTGLQLMSKEVETKTTDFLLTKPVTRSSIWRQKIAAGLAVLSLTQLVVIGFAVGLGYIVAADGMETTKFLLLWGAFIVIQWWFFGLGAALGQLMQRIPSVVGLSLGICFGFFIVALFGAVIGDEAMRWITPFRYIDYLKIVQQTLYDVAHLSFAGLGIGLTLATSLIVFIKRDTPSLT